MNYSLQIIMSPLEENLLCRQSYAGMKRKPTSFGMWVRAVGIDLVFLFGMVVILVFALIACGGKIRWFQASLGLPVGLMVVAIAYRMYKPKVARLVHVREVIRDWFPFLMIDFIYENLHDLAGLVMHMDIALILSKMDILMFGVEPTIWVGKLYHPLVVDIMAIFYALYFAFALVLMLILTVMHRRWAFRRIAMALSITFVFGFIGYIVFPASPPRFLLTSFDPPVLHGLFLFDRLQAAWDGLSVISGGAFPSLHVGISTVALVYAFLWRKASRLFQIIWYFYLPCVIGLWISTIYLRHHWVMDIVAGWAVAFVGCYLADRAVSWWRSAEV